jgi:hypothetical protein
MEDNFWKNSLTALLVALAFIAEAVLLGAYRV